MAFRTGQREASRRRGRSALPVYIPAAREGVRQGAERRERGRTSSGRTPTGVP
jgi:hypothetical protein